MIDTIKHSLVLLILIDLTTTVLATELIRLPIIKQAAPHISKRDNIPAIPLFNANAREYVIEIGLGTPVQKFNVTLDTGSSDLWVPSSKCPKSICSYSRFIEKDSSTCNQTEKVFEIQYGSGSAKGFVAYDTVTISDNLTSANHVLGLAQSTLGMSTSTSDTRVSGILGLGFQGLLRDPKEDTFIQKLLKNQVIKEPVFSIYLNRQADHGYTGEIVIGGYETSRFTGTLNFLPVVNYNKQGQPNLGAEYVANNDAMVYRYWTVPGQAVASYTSDGSKVYETQFPNVQPAILDTGTTLSYLPEKNVIEILETITKDYAPLELNQGVTQAYRVNCSVFTTTQEMWFDFQFSPAVYTMSNEPVVIRVPLKELVLPHDTDDINTATTCLFGLAPISSGFLASIGSGWILGQTVLRSAYVVHDMLEYQIGIGAAANGYFSPSMAASLSATNIAGHHHYYCMVFLSILVIVINSLFV